ncbi:putative aminotransferase class IV [Medicago truncatula]|uniref:Putative aminotransferase class IV n=1 Tax=Medicago truncatula TaxID=3880 RepID=A0A396JWR3_MEDTR|nr:putative aminotransferase class IV [Medicago truncatula]
MICNTFVYHLQLQVVKVDGRTIGDGKVGPVTRKLQAIYKKLTEESGYLYIFWFLYFMMLIRLEALIFPKQNCFSSISPKKKSFDLKFR